MGNTRFIRTIALAAVAVLAAGCGSAATVDLITIGRAGLADARTAQMENHQEILDALASTADALNSAFDADVRLIESGGIVDPDGEPIALTGDWVISARKGYSVAMAALMANVRNAEAVHAVRMDNIAAADESLEMATQLMLRWSALSADAQGQLLTAQDKLIGND